MTTNTNWDRVGAESMRRADDWRQFAYLLEEAVKEAPGVNDLTAKALELAAAARIRAEAVHVAATAPDRLRRYITHVGVDDDTKRADALYEALMRRSREVAQAGGNAQWWIDLAKLLRHVQHAQQGIVGDNSRR